LRLTVRAFGLDLLDIELTTDDDTDESTRAPFGFAGNGTGVIDISGDNALDTYDRRR
jgi:hypothetical protein